ncbi:response regulator transcription factor [bacterium SCSIO 12741]|nr:response regulator transcription factor [bacterium SCSIO 12741]
MDKIKALIIDDEPNAIQVIVKRLQKYFPQVEVIATSQNSEEFQHLTQTYKPDLLFTDIEMPDRNGLEMLETLINPSFETIVVTAYEKYAVEAFKKQALGYILKPVDRDDFIKTVSRALDRIARSKQLNQVIQSGAAEEPGKFAIPYNGSFRIVDLKNVLYLKAEGSYCKIVTTENEFLISKNLKHLTDTLPENNFLRVSRSFVVNMAFIRSICKKDGGLVTMENGTEITIGRKIRSEVMERITDRVNFI